MVFVVYSNDRNGIELTTPQEITGFVDGEFIPRLDVPGDRRAIYDGTTIYVERNGGITPVGIPIPNKKSVLYFDHLVTQFNTRIKDLMNDLNSRN